MSAAVTATTRERLWALGYSRGRLQKQLKKTNNQIGFDLGIKEFLIDTNGIHIDNPKTLYKYQENLLKRKEDVIRLIDEKGLLTEEIRNSVLACSKLTEIEDVYRPYKEKNYNL